MDLFSSSRDLRVTWIVFSSDSVRGSEARDAARRIAKGPLNIELLEFRSSYFPYDGAQIKDYFEKLKLRVNPDVILTHHRADAHQDHRTIADLTWNTFRDHTVLEYEIPKFDGDLAHPNVFVPISEDTAHRKVDVIIDAFRSQHDRNWFSRENFLALMRLRGIECNSPTGFAEAFHCRKLSLRF